MKLNLRYSFAGLAIFLISAAAYHIAYKHRDHTATSIATSIKHDNVINAETVKTGLNSGISAHVIETNLMPIQVESDFLAGRENIGLGAGAITAVRERIIILDRLGRTFSYENGSIQSDPTPPLPMNVDEYSNKSKFPLDESTLRTHAIAYNAKRNSLFASFEVYDADMDATHFEVAEIKLDQNGHGVGSWMETLRGPPLHSKEYYSGRGAGGKMAFDGDLMYLAIGDYNLDHGDYIAAQQMDSFYGKTYKFNLVSHALEMISLGHRVPLGIMVDKEKKLWITENSARGGDKLERIEPGQNYGWPIDTLGTQYFQYRSSAIKTGVEDKYAKPIMAWVPSIAPTQILQVSHFDDSWDGDFLIGSLKGQSLYRVKMDNGIPLYAEQIWLGHRIRDLINIKGAIIIWTDDGTLLRVTPERNILNKNVLNEQASYTKPELASCSNCHSFSEFSPLPWGPTLAGIYGKGIGTSRFAYYSKAMENRGGIWDEANLAGCLSNPSAFVPGTSMPGVQLDAERIGLIIEDLKNAKGIASSSAAPH